MFRLVDEALRAMNQPLVSIVLPAFNRAGYLRSAIESVLAQSLTNWEMLVADDGSGPEAAEYLRGLGDPRIRVLWLAHSGNPSVARNAALREARGTYVAFLDSDDLWAPNKLEAQTAALRARAQCHWSFTNVDWIDHAGGLMRPRETFVPHEGRIVEALLTIDAYVALPTVLVERRLLDEAGPFDEELRFGEDYDLWLRLATRSDVVAVADKLTQVRLHAGNHSHDRRGFYRDWLRLYEKAGARTTDPRLLDICRRKRAAMAVGLASIEAADGQAAASYRRLANALPDGWRYWRWWLSAARMLVSSSLPRWAKARALPIVSSEFHFRLLAKHFGAEVICDVGAFDCFHSRRFRAMGAKVIALEANPVNFEVLARDASLAAAGIELFNYAAWNRDEEITFNVIDAAARDVAWRKLISSIRERAPDTRYASKPVRVRGVRLDTFLTEVLAGPERTIALWIDVEGAAYEVLEGIAGIRDRVCLVHVEVETRTFWQGQHLWPEIDALMRQFGFTPIARSTGVEQFDVLFVNDRWFARSRAAVSGTTLLAWARLRAGRARNKLRSWLGAHA